MGIMRLGKEYGQERLEAACSRALTIGSPSYKRIQAILKKGLDRLPLQKEVSETSCIHHADIRGPEYYHITKGEHTHVDSPDH